MVRMLVERYAGGAYKQIRGLKKVEAPVEYPDVGLYHPHVAGRVVERIEDLPQAGNAGTVGLLLLRSYILAGNAVHYDGVIAALEARGLRVIPGLCKWSGSASGSQKILFSRWRAKCRRRDFPHRILAGRRSRL